MNNTNNTEELLKTIDLTLDDIMTIIKNGVNGRYRSFKALQETTTKEDLEQDVLLFYLSTMKSTGDVRLNHYIKKYHDKQHIINLIKQTSYQLPIYFLRSKEVVNRAVLSLDSRLNEYDTYNLDTWLDIMEDVSAARQIEDRISVVDLATLITKELDDTNFTLLKSEYTKSKKETNSEVSLLLNVQDYVNTYNSARQKTLVQLQIIKDLCAGYSKKDMKTRYATFAEDLSIIKKVLRNNLKTYFATSF